MVVEDEPDPRSVRAHASKYGRKNGTDGDRGNDSATDASIDMSLIAWSWLFLALYIGLMLGLGLVAQRRVQHADDFATARGAYGPLFLALAFAASTASGVLDAAALNTLSR